MSVDQLPTRPAKPAPGGTKLVQYDEYIDQQVESTRRVVKLVDLATSLVVMAAGVLAYLLVVAVAEHWIVPGGFPFAVRVVLLGLLVCGVGYYAIRRIWPLVIGKINPVYAAQAIEQTGPSLKNSLVNLLLFRQKRAGISDAVYKTLEEQAAQRLSRVPVDAAVDRTLLIRFGYVLIAIVAVAGLYKVFSPKDPIVAAKRVLMPWANIVPASRVTIQDIEPGEVTVSRGENLVVSAEVRGVGDDDSVVLKYTTRDGQSVDKPVRMKVAAADGMRYEGRLPQEGGPSAEVGLAESLTYRIEAGDARSLDYAVTVVPTPTILVERIEYDYPEYTGYVDQPVENLADIRAIEGTRVTIHARANGPIAEAHVDFDADGRRELAMTAREMNAKASFVLELRDDRTTYKPKHASYVLRFMNDERRPNINPVKHSIAVDPDYAPEASIVAPREEILDVRLDETVTIEVEARDPDFLIGDVRLHCEAAGRPVMEQRLLKAGPQKRFATRYQFTPKSHNLRAGDTVHYWIAASDNKTPSPNTTLTKKQVLRIVSPDPAKQPPPDRLAQRDPQQRQQPGGQQGEQGGEQGEQGGQQSQDDAAGGQQQGGNRQQGEKGGQQEGSEQEQRQGEGETGRQGDSQENQSEQQEEQGGESQAGGEGARDRQQGESGQQNETGQQDGQSGEQGQSQGEGQPGGEGQSGGKQQQGKPNSNDKQTGAGAAGGEPSNGAQPDGTRPDSNQGGSSANGARSENGQRPPEASAPPVSSEGDDDAEAFNRIQKHLEQDGELKDGEAPSSDQGSSRDAQRSEKQGQVDKETGRQGDTEKSESTGETGEQTKEGTKPQAEGEQNGDGQQKDGGAEQKPGAQTQSGDPSQVKEQPGEQGEESKSQGGEQSTTKGESGAGNEQKSQGAPNSQPEMKQGEKREQQGSQSEKSNEQEPPAGARGKKESDSQGEEGGDRAGGGEEGGGQKAPRDGTGSAGQNQSADEGGGESGEQGKGNVSSNPGQDSVANNQEGTPGGETKGRGRKQQPGEGDEPGGAEPGEPADGDQQQGTEGGKQAQDTGSNRGAPTGQGGNQGSDGTPAPRDGGTVPDGDKANLEYARERTDLVLERLSDQLKRKRVDDKLLKQLGWSEDELRRFVERWETRKRAAEQSDATGETARRELDDALRSLGLRRGPMQQNRVQDDRMRDLKEGYRGPVPLEYRDRLKAYNQGVSRAGEDGE